MDINSLVKNSLNTRQSVEDYINNLVNSYIVKPSEGNNTGIGGFIFNILDRESIVLSSEITDHYVESNFSYQDHISIRPEEFTLRGYVGEIADIIPSAGIGVLTKIQSMANVAPFMNEFSVQATQTYAKITEVTAKVGNVLNQAQNIFDIFTNNSNSNTKQEKAFSYFYSLWQSRILVDVTTPYCIMKNMAIKNIEVIQNGDTKFISDFNITFKRIRIATTKTVKQTKLRSSALTDARNNMLTVGGLIPKLGKDRVGAMLSSPISGGATAGSSFNYVNQAVTTDLLPAGPTGGGGW